MILRQQPAGAPARLLAVERGLAVIASLPALAAVGTLEAGEGESLTDLRLKLSEAPVISGVAIVDNEAERSLGTWRALASWAKARPFRGSPFCHHRVPGDPSDLSQRPKG